MSAPTRCEIIAEAGVNHDGSLDAALRLIDVAADAGADVVKFQTFVASNLIAKGTRKADYQTRNTGESDSQLDMVRRLELPFAAFHTLAAHCDKRGIAFLSTPFDFESLAFLTGELGLTTLKIASGEVTNLPFLVACGRRARRVILSTGMCRLGEIELALAALAYGALGEAFRPTEATLANLLGTPAAQRFIREKVSILHCTTEYPSPPASIQLRSMETLRTAFGVPVGLSDHSEGIHIPVAAAAMGATILEKHFTLDRTLPGPDHKASLSPDELRAMVRAVRDVEAALGTGRKLPDAVETSNREIARKVVVAARPLKAGELLTEADLALKRAGRGLDPIHWWRLVGTSATRDYRADEPLED